MNKELLTVGNVVTIAAMAYVFVWLANRGLDMIGLSDLKTGA